MSQIKNGQKLYTVIVTCIYVYSRYSRRKSNVCQALYAEQKKWNLFWTLIFWAPQTSFLNLQNFFWLTQIWSIMLIEFLYVFFLCLIAFINDFINFRERMWPDVFTKIFSVISTFIENSQQVTILTFPGFKARLRG